MLYAASVGTTVVGHIICLGCHLELLSDRVETWRDCQLRFLPSFVDSHPALSILVLWLHIQPRAELLQSRCLWLYLTSYVLQTWEAPVPPEGEPPMANTSVTRKGVLPSQGFRLHVQQL